MNLLQQYLDLRVLVAEDNPGHRQMLTAILTALGVDADVVGDGRQAVAAAARAPYDLILMDLSMPVMDGLTAIQLIRYREDRQGQPHAQIHVISSQDGLLDQHASRQAGADGHIAKPLHAARLIRALEDAAGHRRRARQQQAPAALTAHCPQPAATRH